MVVKRYRNQKTRGSEGFGFVSLDKGKVARFLKSEQDEPIIKEILDRTEDEIMFHHRKPTSTPNYWQTAHPMKVSHESLKHDYYVIHNGCVHDTEEIKARHDKEGFVYSTLLTQYWLSQDKKAHRAGEKWNDSETFAIELAKDLDGKQEGVKELRGTIAFIALQVGKENKKATTLFWGRNYGSPLKFQKTTDYMQITSEGAGEDVAEHTLNSYDYEMKTVSSRKDYPVGVTAYASAGYDYSRNTRTIKAAETRAEEDDYGDTIKFGQERKGPVGFQNFLDKPKEERSLVSKDEALAKLEGWFEDMSELEQVNKSIKHLTTHNAPDADNMEYFLDRKSTLEASIKRFEEANVQDLSFKKQS